MFNQLTEKGRLVTDARGDGPETGSTGFSVPSTGARPDQDVVMAEGARRH
jgi:hypothetical protein